jgi:Flp pilus assembly protein TadB
MSDPLGVALLALGIGFAIAGFLWMERAVPTPDDLEDELADMIELVAAALESGSSLGVAFELAAAGPLGRERVHVERALRLARLGSRWHAALRLTGHPPLEELSQVIEPSRDFGTPLVPALRVWVQVRRCSAATKLDRAMKRAPVRMIPPLTLCVLPSFVLLGLGPFIRELARVV